jgi:tetratricopeptide (TPR) repeat protein
MRRVTACALALLSLAGCATPLQLGEQRYREGDRLGALDIWRAVPPDDRQYPAVSARIAVVEEEFERLVVAYKDNARQYEADGRLAESVLDYRLALELQPGDADTLAHVQQLARELVTRKAALREQYDKQVARGDLEAARDDLALLRSLDPFDPEFETEERQLQAELRAEWRQRRARIRAQLAGEVDSLVEAGRAAFADEQLESALELWRRALLIDPDNERIQAYIARAERQLENLRRLRSEHDASGGH